MVHSGYSSYHKNLLRQELMRRHDMICHWCGCTCIYFPMPVKGKQPKQPDNYATIDHYYGRLDPRRTAETKWLTVLACHKCNQRRGQEDELKLPIEKLRERAGGRVPLALMSTEERNVTLERIMRVGRRKDKASVAHWISSEV
jgi:hypothetical protein